MEYQSTYCSPPKSCDPLFLGGGLRQKLQIVRVVRESLRGKKFSLVNSASRFHFRMISLSFPSLVILRH